MVEVSSAKRETNGKKVCQSLQNATNFTTECYQLAEKTFKRGVLRIFEWQLSHPFLIFSTVGLLCLILNVIAFCIHSPNLDTNPDQAFQTWKTNISGIFKTWEMLEKQLTFVPPPQIEQHIQLDRPQIAMAGAPFLMHNARARVVPPPATVTAERVISFAKCLESDNNMLNAIRLLNTEPSKVPGIVMAVIFESINYESFFTKNSMHELCTLETDVNSAVVSKNTWVDLIAQEPREIKAVKSPVHVSFFDFIKCISITGSGCSNIDAETVQQISQIYREKHDCIETACKIPWETKSAPNFCNSTLCSETFCAGLELASTLERDLIRKYVYQGKLQMCTAESLLLSHNAWKYPGPIYSGLYIYFPQNNSKTIWKAFKSIWRKKDQLKHLRLVGIVPPYDIITSVFGGLLRYDLCRLATIALCVLFTVMWVYTKSICYTVASIVTLGFSFGLTYFVYVYIFGFDFWFTNYLAAIILLGIGADDCFVLKHLMRQIYEPPKVDGETSFCLDTECVKSLRHAALAMVVTSATTAIAFSCNLMTDVVAIKSFGVFSATLVLICYGLVVTWLPVCIVLEERYVSRFWEAAKCGKISAKLSEKMKLPFIFVFERILPAIVDKLKYLFAVFSVATFCASCVIVFAKPKLSMGEGRPQLFHNTHPIQWFWDNYATKFKLGETETEEILHVVWGVKPVDLSSPIHRSDTGNPSYYPGFEITEGFMAKQEDFCKIMNRNTDYKMSYCFAHEYFSWLSPAEQRTVCRNATNVLNCKLKFVIDKLRSYGPFFLTHDTLHREQFQKNGPLFLKSGPTSIRAYIQTFKRSFPSSYVDCPIVSNYYEEVQNQFHQAMQQAGLNESANERGWVVPSSSEAARYLFMCDLQKELSTNTVPSVLVSLGIALVVVAMVTRNLKLGLASVFIICSIILSAIACLVLAKWKLNIVESIVIILCVGLSFDFTLHYAVGYKITHKECVNVREQIDSMFREAAIPVFLSAFSTFTAGLAFTFADAYPFYQIGVFMVIITTASWIGSTFLFTSCVAVLDTVINRIRIEKYDVT